MTHAFDQILKVCLRLFEISTHLMLHSQHHPHTGIAAVSALDFVIIAYLQVHWLLGDVLW